MTKKISGALAISVMLILFPALAWGQDASTTREREDLSPRAANRSVQRDLLSVLEPVDKIESGMSRRLRGVGLTTHAYATEFEGVCRRDAVTLWYAPTERSSDPEDMPLRPYSLDAQPLFHIVKLPHEERRDMQEGRYVWGAQCNSIGRREDVNWFSSKDARTAVQGALVLDAALEEVRSGRLKAKPCPNIFDIKTKTCEEAILATGKASEIDTVEPCFSEPGGVCFAIDLSSSTKLTITATVAGDELAPTSVKSISIEQYIIVT